MPEITTTLSGPLEKALADCITRVNGQKPEALASFANKHAKPLAEAGKKAASEKISDVKAYEEARATAQAESVKLGVTLLQKDERAFGLALVLFAEVVAPLVK